MFDFSKYNLQELQAMSDLLDYLREDVGAESYSCGCALPRVLIHESLRLSRSILMSLEQQACDASEDPPSSHPAEEPANLRDMQSLVDDLCRCAVRLAALADAEDGHFAECSLVDVYNKVILLRGGSKAVSNLLADIRDHYDGLH